MTIEFVEAFAQSSPVAVQHALTSAIRRHFGDAGIANVLSGFQKAFDAIGPNWNSIADAIRRRSGDIAAESAAAVAANVRKLAATKGRFEPVFGMPTGPGGHIADTYVRVGKVHLGVSPTGGRLFGFGFMTNTHRKPQGEVLPVFRIDYWDMRTQAEGRPTPTPLHVHYHIANETQKHPPRQTIWP